ncbi:helix-turn-helix domain-containing protein [Amycolatopsis acidiphila]|uniref:PucR family transcriptional regulator n=1 Tax=Amycolatopsis acidiphila TaxID=715473 RepID=UPI001643BD1C|nr:PucR family transcriptional regulator [Amycolatopsis acidiphila]UIJ61983.1 helix-turn-helix domain-containing protein [Amycolatopsis acidiphila]GHG56772.1 transcriptional regulator [Amycolatopsis acidiphila]
MALSDRTSLGLPLRQLLLAVGEPLLERVAGSLDTLVQGVGIFDPDDEVGAFPGELVLVVGARGREAVRSVRAAARAGAAAAVVKNDGRLDDLRAAAEDSGIALLTVRPRMRWDQLQTLLREVLEAANLAAESPAEGGDLFALAQTVAVLTSGSVTIEDAGNRVLAYSRSDDEIDELRRLSILGWEGPEQYLALLREWGVYQRLRSGEEVVRVDERPELGIRRRLAVGIRAGTQHLGTIWVQEGARPFAERAESALLGAARLAAVQLLRRRSPSVRPREDLVEGLLEGRVSADLVAGQLGLDPSAPAAVLAFAAREIERDRSEHELHQLEISNVVSVHATSYRRGALVGTVGSRVYAVLPEAGSSLTTLAGHVVGVLRRAGVRAQAGIGSVAPALGDVVTSRHEADRVLDAMARTPERDMATISDLRAEILLDETLSLVEANPDLRDPAVTALVGHDAEHGTELVPSLLAYLEALGDVRAAATDLHIHPNTLRHRLRRVTAVSGLHLDDPRERLVCHLQLLLATRLPGTRRG